MRYAANSHPLLLTRCTGLLVFGCSMLLAAQLLADSGRTGTTPPRADALSPSYEVQTFRDLAYRDLCAGEDPAKEKNKLDLYLPRGSKDFPVVFFVHGGAWRHGNKDFLGVYSSLGRLWAKQGFGAVVTNYRLFPEAHHPQQIQDVAKAFAWTCKNIAAYGGRADQIFVSGHSAGGHLVSLLATDEQYLKAEGLGLDAIKGVITISGVYDVASMELGLFANVFGKNLEERRKASPLCCVGAHHPPFLILYADSDFPTCDEMSAKFCKALQASHCEARSEVVKDCNHITILLRLNKLDDVVAQSVRGFITDHVNPVPQAVGQ